MMSAKSTLDVKKRKDNVAPHLVETLIPRGINTDLRTSHEQSRMKSRVISGQQGTPEESEVSG
jgi:hypothetical protein